MEIQLNGKSHTLTSPLTVSELLASLGLAGKPVVAEVNLEAVLPRHFSETTIKSGDRVEIIALAAGG